MTIRINLLQLIQFWVIPRQLAWGRFTSEVLDEHGHIKLNQIKTKLNQIYKNTFVCNVPFVNVLFPAVGNKSFLKTIWYVFSLS